MPIDLPIYYKPWATVCPDPEQRETMLQPPVRIALVSALVLILPNELNVAHTIFDQALININTQHFGILVKVYCTFLHKVRLVRSKLWVMTSHVSAKDAPNRHQVRDPSLLAEV